MLPPVIDMRLRPAVSRLGQGSVCRTAIAMHSARHFATFKGAQSAWVDDGGGRASLSEHLRVTGSLRIDRRDDLRQRLRQGRELRRPDAVRYSESGERHPLEQRCEATQAS